MDMQEEADFDKSGGGNVWAQFQHKVTQVNKAVCRLQPFTFWEQK